MFISQTKRNKDGFGMNASKNQKSKVLQYDNIHNTIQEVVNKKTDPSANSNPLIANIKAKRGVKSGFSSNVPRFQGKKIDEADQFVGPGYYDINQNNFEVNIGPHTTSGNLAGASALGGNSKNSKSQTFMTKAQRFNYSDKKQEQVPGPGQYSYQDMNRWYKRSYNMIFTD
jgi:hypothetical protein